MAKKKKKYYNQNFKKTARDLKGYSVGAKPTESPVTSMLFSNESIVKNLIKKSFKKYKSWYEVSAKFFVLYMFCIFPFIINPTYKYSNITVTKLYTYWVGLIIFCIFPGLIYIITHWRWKLLAVNPVLAIKKAFKTLRPYEICALSFLLIVFITDCISPTVDDSTGKPTFSSFFSIPVTIFPSTGGAATLNTARKDSLAVWFMYMMVILYLGRFYKYAKIEFILFGVFACFVSILAFAQWTGHDIFQYSGSADGSEARSSYFFASMSQGDVAGTYFGLVMVSVTILLFINVKRQNASLNKLTKLKVNFQQNYLQKNRPLILRTAGITMITVAFVWVIHYILTWNNENDVLRGNSTIVNTKLLVILSILSIIVNLVVIKLDKLLLLVAFVLIFLAVWLIHTDAMLVGFLGVLFIVPLLLSTHKKIIIPVGSVIIILFLVFLPQIGNVANKLGFSSLQDAAKISRGHFEDQQGNGRIGIWRTTFDILNNNPIRYFIGYGPANFSSGFNNATDKNGISISQQHGNTGRVDKAHNEYLHIVFEEGIFGLLAQLFLFGFIIYRIQKLAIKSRSPGFIIPLALCVFYLIQAVFTIQTPVANPLDWTVWGIAASFGYRYLRNDNQSKSAVSQN